MHCQCSNAWTGPKEMLAKVMMNMVRWMHAYTHTLRFLLRLPVSPCSDIAHARGKHKRRRARPKPSHTHTHTHTHASASSPPLLRLSLAPEESLLVVCIWICCCTTAAVHVDVRLLLLLLLFLQCVLPPFGNLGSNFRRHPRRHSHGLSIRS